MSLAERLVLLHVGSTSALLVVLGVVSAVRHALDRFGPRRVEVVPSPAPRTQVVRSLEPRTADPRTSRQPRVAGDARRSS